MFNPTRSQVAFAVAVFGGLIVGKLIKNFKVGMILAVILGLLLAFSWKRKR
jgi:hypothetical protein